MNSPHSTATTSGVTITTPEPTQITLDGEARGVTPTVARVSELPAHVLTLHPRG